MMPEEKKNNDELKTDSKSSLNHKLAAVGWSLFFIWVGIALLLKVNSGVGLLGVGIITLGMQAARSYFNLKIERFWIVIGLLFVIGGLWDLFQPKLPLVPIMIIVAGIILFYSALRKKHSKKE